MKLKLVSDFVDSTRSNCTRCSSSNRRSRTAIPDLDAIAREVGVTPEFFQQAHDAYMKVRPELEGPAPTCEDACEVLKILLGSAPLDQRALYEIGRRMTGQAIEPNE